MTDTAEAVKKCIAEQLCISESEITNEHTFDALGADSLDMAEIEIVLEDELGIMSLEGEVPFDIHTTVGTYIAAVESYVAANPKKPLPHFQH